MLIEANKEYSTEGEEKTIRKEAHPENFATDIGDPIFFKACAFSTLDKVCHRTTPTKLHHQP